MALAEKVLGRTFADKELLRRALTHPSAVEGAGSLEVYERLEFLGDSVLGFVIAEEVYRRFPEMPEGPMTRVKNAAVSGATLSAAAEELGLADALLMGESEMGTGRRGLTSALEDTFEALTAALFLDAGLDAAREWTLGVLGKHITESAAGLSDNPKGALQELLQARGATPVYRLASQEGPPHDRTFTVSVLEGETVLGVGSGRSKKDAEAAAAQEALDALVTAE